MRLEHTQCVSPNTRGSSQRRNYCVASRWTSKAMRSTSICLGESWRILDQTASRVRRQQRHLSPPCSPQASALTRPKPRTPVRGCAAKPWTDAAVGVRPSVRPSFIPRSSTSCVTCVQPPGPLPRGTPPGRGLLFPVDKARCFAVGAGRPTTRRLTLGGMRSRKHGFSGRQPETDGQGAKS